MFVPVIKPKAGERGIALVWVAAVLVAVGLFSAGVLSLLRPIDYEKQEKTTEQNMRQILYALSAYAQKNSRLPCPADPDRTSGPEPFGAERGSGASGNSYGDCTGADVLGIVPFRTLGLSERDIRDGWRNFITYRMSAAFETFDPTEPPGHYPQVHEICREKDVWVFPAGNPPDKANVNPQKAIFCCGGAEAGFDVVDGGGASLPYPSGVIPVAVNPVYKHLHTPKPHVAAGGTVPEKLAVVLVSHGGNGHGAFLDDGTRIDLGNVFAAEDSNADADGLFVLLPRNYSDSAYFDDMIMWRTQSHILSEVGGNSDFTPDCSSPFP